MDPETVLNGLCQECGVPLAEGRGYTPLVRRALDLPPDDRERLLAVVRAGLLRRAAELTESERLRALIDERTLRAVAAVLHGWGE